MQHSEHSKMNPNNLELAKAFPFFLRSEVDTVLNNIDLDSELSPLGSYSVLVLNELLEIPYRIYTNDKNISPDIELTVIQRGILDCIYSRHHNGFVRARCLSNIMKLEHAWVVPYVISLVGEYVVEILDIIHQNMEDLDKTKYREFLKSNPEFYQKTKQRVFSYWDCYYRGKYPKRENYVGVRILEFFDGVLNS